MTDLSEETGQRIAKALERLADAVERNPWMQTGPGRYVPASVPNNEPGLCAYCGGFHGNGLMCPKLSPTAISVSGKTT